MAAAVQPQCLLDDENSAICIAQGYTTVPTNFQHSITTLKLSNNDIFALSAKVLKLYQEVTELDLEHNKIALDRNIKAVFVLRKLQILNLSGNSLQSIDFLVFSNNLYLKELVIDNNPGMYIKEKLVSLRSLVKLSLRNNKLSSSPMEVLKGFSNLETLDLRDNDITGLPEEILKILPKLVSLYLNGNPIAKLDYRVFQVSDLKYRNGLTDMTTIKGPDIGVSTELTTPDYSLRMTEHDLSSTSKLNSGLWYFVIGHVSAAVVVSLLLFCVFKHLYKRNQERQQIAYV